MRAPSQKKLMEVFRLDAKQARLIRRLAKDVDDAGALAKTVEKCCPKTQSYVRSMYSDPYDSHMWRVTVALHGMNEVMDAHGVEPLGPTGGSSDGYAPRYEFINMGDTYATTLLYNRRSDSLSIGSWGDLVEHHPEWE